jgi:hypothetical protein
MKFHVAVLALALSVPAAFADSLNRTVTVVNDTDFTMQRFFASNKDSTSWEEDILGDSVLDPHSEINIKIDDGTGYCIYDFKAVFDDGDEVEERGVNVCEIGKWTVH